MYERSYGAKYDASLSTKQIAAAIRNDIKVAKVTGDLPSDWKYSVVTDHFSGGSAIRVTAKSPRPVRLMDTGYVAAAKDKDRVVQLPVNGALQSCLIRAGDQWLVRPVDVDLPEAAKVEAALKAMHQAYNHDGSDSQIDYFDVKFYGQVAIETLPGVPEVLHERPSYLPARVTAPAAFSKNVPVAV